MSQFGEKHQSYLEEKFGSSEPARVDQDAGRPDPHRSDAERRLAARELADQGGFGLDRHAV